MAEITKTRNYITYFWFLVAIFLFMGLVIHKPQIDTTTYTALWLTEMITFLVIGLYFLKPNTSTAMGAAIASLIWLINQFACWYHYTVGTPTYVATALINSLVFAFVLWQNSASPAKRIHLGLSETKHKTYGTFAMFFMLIFAIWKLWLDMQYGAYAGITWAFGILLLVIASLITLLDMREFSAISTIIAIIGFAASAYATLMYDLTLRLLTAL